MSGYEVYGALGSPYSMKVRAAMRAKRLPHTWTGMTGEERGQIMPNVKAPVIPVIKRPDGTWTNDSTPFLLSIESEGRPLLPPDPAQRFACLLLEDMADEWFMKAMFHYRWFYKEDAEWCANWLIFDTLPNAGRKGVEETAAGIRARQISRMALVGCTPETAPLIEASWKRVNKALEAMALGPTRFLFGDVVSLADLAFYGQLKVMSYDPTPMAWLRAETPYLYRWLDHADDAGGIEGGWTDGMSESVKDLLAICGETYLPFLQANVDALEAGAETFSLTIEGGRYEQGVFKYQAKCLEALKAEWVALDSASKAALSAAIGKGASLLD
ncbi:MAG: glutathione S-transferase family protein [Alphaproteobacteria bacterium]|nr:glutathione S-transferase family protein [Alphaproteobacteria bacterium]MBU2083355.1 glutathione S-transferase family protein [Alphaproteobacteria bacterium]MBU2143680.1 glutathione S-transferase family protein [Alphaproteobacteria bacterium]MBU2195639.1 glutathione S-transferase family protein [Alphaproteobacteria bacterium]